MFILGSSDPDSFAGKVIKSCLYKCKSKLFFICSYSSFSIEKRNKFSTGTHRIRIHISPLPNHYLSISIPTPGLETGRIDFHFELEVFFFGLSNDQAVRHVASGQEAIIKRREGGSGSGGGVYLALDHNDRLHP